MQAPRLLTSRIRHSCRQVLHRVGTSMEHFIITPGDRILVTGAAGFIGERVVHALLQRGFHNLVCFVRPSSDVNELDTIVNRLDTEKRVEIFRGNLLSREDCDVASRDVNVVLHLAAGTGEKSFPDAFMNSVVTTRNLIESSLRSKLRRFVLVSSFSVYTNRQKSRVLDETCPIEEKPHLRGDAYCYAKVKQEEIIREYAENAGLKYVILRPGSVYGPVKSEIVGRVGISTFGRFLHLGGANRVPFTYVDNCADAIVLAGLTKGIDGEVFNVLDDDLPTSRQFLRLYKKNVKRFPSTYLPHAVSFGLSYAWEKYAGWSNGQLPPAFNRSRWNCYWRRVRYTNAKLKSKLCWTPKVTMKEGMRLYFEACARSEAHA